MKDKKQKFINLKNPKHLKNLRFVIIITSAIIIIGGFIALLYRIDSGFIVVVVGALYYFIGMVVINKLLASITPNPEENKHDFLI